MIITSSSSKTFKFEKSRYPNLFVQLENDLLITQLVFFVIQKAHIHVVGLIVMFKILKICCMECFLIHKFNPRYKRIINLVVLSLKDNNGFG